MNKWIKNFRGTSAAGRCKSPKYSVPNRNLETPNYARIHVLRFSRPPHFVLADTDGIVGSSASNEGVIIRKSAYAVSIVRALPFPGRLLAHV